jgi:FdhE protein
LRLLAGIARAQADLAVGLPPVTSLAPDLVERAAANGMPPIDRARLPDDPLLHGTIARVLDAMAAIPMPAPAAAALAALRDDPTRRERHLANALEDAVAADDVAAHVFVAAGLQLHAVRLAATLPAESLRPVGTGLCPACGGGPVASVLVDRPSAARNVRYCVCATCATQWNAVRVTCVLCGNTEGITYQHIEGRKDGIEGETCAACHGYLKILDQTENPALDPVADDVASLALDMMLRDAGWRRGGVNPFLAGY